MNTPANDLAMAQTQQGTPQDNNRKCYQDEIEPKDVSPEMFDLLENYSHIAPDSVIPFLTELRERAFKVHPYPCIGLLRFLHLALSQHPLYPDILSRLKTQSHTLLDIGCCFGQDLRKLAYDGAPSSLLYGLDVKPEFIDLGYELFRDKASLKSTFVTGDILSSDTRWSASLDEKLDIINASAFFHLFSYPDQIAAGKRLVSFLRPVPGSMVVGGQIGSTKPGEYAGLRRTSFLHDVASFEKLWNVVGGLTGTQWKVEAELDVIDTVRQDNIPTESWSGPNKRWIRFAVIRK